VCKLRQPQDFNQCLLQYKLALRDLEDFESSEKINYLKGFLFLKNERRKSGNGVKYYKNAYLITVDYIDGKRVQHFKYIKKSELPYIQEKLSRKTQNRRKYRDLKLNVINLRKQLLKIMKKNKLDDEMLEKIEENRREHELFLKEDRYKNANSVSILGEKVRSRAECILAAIAFALKIPYFYEPAVRLQGFDDRDDIFNETVRPDFALVINGKTILTELLGMSDKKEYNENWERKHRHYEDCGYVQGENLVCISCKDKFNIDSQAMARTLMNLVKGIIPQRTVYV